MANEVYSSVEFYGNRGVMDQVEKWSLALASYNATEDDPNCSGAIREVFYPDNEEDLDYGSESVFADSFDQYSFSFQSEWNIPDELIKHIAGKLSEIDKNVVVKVTASNGAQQWTAFAATNEDGETFFFSSLEVDEHDEDGDLLDGLEDAVVTEQYDAIQDLVDSVQNVAWTLQEHFKPALLVKRLRNDDNDESDNSRVAVVWATCRCGSGREYLLCCGSDSLTDYQDDRIDQIMREENLSIADAFNVLMERKGYA